MFQIFYEFHFNTMICALEKFLSIIATIKLKNILYKYLAYNLSHIYYVF